MMKTPSITCNTFMPPRLQAEPFANAAGQWTCRSCRQRNVQTGSRSFSSITPAANKGSSSISTGKQTWIPSAGIWNRPRRRYGASSLPERPGGKLPETPARTRFAPSPTGYLHIGGLRTALFSYLLAKRTQGQFVLRIEDTDQKRLVSDAEQRLCDDLQWAGLQWDEGPQVGGLYGPYKQSERNDIYQQHARHLLDSGAAYRCFCPTLTSKAAYVTSGCHNNCSSLSPEAAQDRAESKHEPFTVRLRQAMDASKRAYPDLIYGNIKRLKRSPSPLPDGPADAVGDAADTILVKSDGIPTYHFANVVDDHLMEITHVIRGTEWMASTPLHYDLYTAFGWQPPAFAHVGLLVDENKVKLSKREDQRLVLDVKGMREQGILPEVLCNFLVLLGWSNPTRNDVIEMQELARIFDLKFTKGNTIVKMDKLWFLQKNHVARRIEHARSENSQGPLQAVIDHTRDQALKIFGAGLKSRFPIDSYPDLDAYVRVILLLASTKTYTTPEDYVHRHRYFFEFDPTQLPNDGEGSSKPFEVSTESLRDLSETLVLHTLTAKDFAFRAQSDAAEELNKMSHHVQNLIQTLSAERADRVEWTHPESGKPNSSEMRQKALYRAVMRYLRDRLSYGLPGPSVGHILVILGREECIRRLALEPLNVDSQKTALSE